MEKYRIRLTKSARKELKKKIELFTKFMRMKLSFPFFKFSDIITTNNFPASDVSLKSFEKIYTPSTSTR